MNHFADFTAFPGAFEVLSAKDDFWDAVEGLKRLPQVVGAIKKSKTKYALNIF